MFARVQKILLMTAGNQYVLSTYNCSRYVIETKIKKNNKIILH